MASTSRNWQVKHNRSDMSWQTSTFVTSIQPSLSSHCLCGDAAEIWIWYQFSKKQKDQAGWNKVMLLSEYPEFQKIAFRFPAEIIHLLWILIQFNLIKYQYKGKVNYCLCYDTSEEATFARSKPTQSLWVGTDILWKFFHWIFFPWIKHSIFAWVCIINVHIDIELSVHLLQRFMS